MHHTHMHASGSMIEEHRYMHHTCMYQDQGPWINASYIWVIFPRTGKMSKMCHNFFFEASLWPNGLIFSSFLNCSEEIMSVRVWKYSRFGPSKFFWFKKIMFFAQFHCTPCSKNPLSTVLPTEKSYQVIKVVEL